jgi:hypothetical protein
MGAKIWPLTFRKEHTLGVSANRVLRKIFRPTRQQVIEGLRKLQNKSLHNLYSSHNIISIIKRKQDNVGRE